MCNASGNLGDKNEACSENTKRVTLSLNGTWQVGEGSLDQMPSRYDRTVVIPGFADSATPQFEDVGRQSSRREAFWFRRTFTLPHEARLARLKIHKVKYGAQVWVNGQCAGDALSCFTPATLNITSMVRAGSENELVVRVGASPVTLPKNIPYGFCFEKRRYLPGIYDSVEIFLSETPAIADLQTGYDFGQKRLRVRVTLAHPGNGQTFAPVSVTVREKMTGVLAGEVTIPGVNLSAGEQHEVEASVAIACPREWSPEYPFLYEVTADTGADAHTVTTGLCQFRFLAEQNRAMLNGSPYPLRGTTVAFLRFEEHAGRRRLPWDETWVRKLFRKFKEMNWNCCRFHIGFPPELWYRVADEEGMCIIDEYPYWFLGEEKRNRSAQAIAVRDLENEYSKWVRERCFHPCVVIWSAQNETHSEKTTPAADLVRPVDLAARPWNNGWSRPGSGDAWEAHLYPIQNNFCFQLSSRYFKELSLAGDKPWLWCDIQAKEHDRVSNEKHAVLLTEYGWLWMDYDGFPSAIPGACSFYGHHLGTDATPSERFWLYARLMARFTEGYRASGRFAGVLYYAALSFDKGHSTAGDLSDLEGLRFHPFFEEHMRDAFAPVGCMLDFWAHRAPGGATLEADVCVTNDLPKPCDSTIVLALFKEGKALYEQEKRCAVLPWERTRTPFSFMVPDEPGRYELCATLRREGASPVTSRHSFTTVPVVGNCSLAGDWTVFAPLALADGSPSAKDLAALPDVIRLGAREVKGEKVSVQTGVLNFEEMWEDLQEGRVALVFIPFVVGVSGEQTFGLGANYWYEAWIDGKPLHDVLKTRGQVRPSVGDYLVTVVLEAGNHLLAVRFIGGSAGANIGGSAGAKLCVGGPVEVRKCIIGE